MNKWIILISIFMSVIVGELSFIYGLSVSNKQQSSYVEAINPLISESSFKLLEGEFIPFLKSISKHDGSKIYFTEQYNGILSQYAIDKSSKILNLEINDEYTHDKIISYKIRPEFLQYKRFYKIEKNGVKTKTVYTDDSFVVGKKIQINSILDLVDASKSYIEFISL